MAWEVFERRSAMSLPRAQPRVSVYVSDGGWQLRINRAALEALGVSEPCHVALLHDRANGLGAIRIDHTGKEFRLSIQKGVGFIGCKLYIQRALGVSEKMRCRAWADDEKRLVFKISEGRGE